MKLYVVEGNIGVGKSTTLERLRGAGYTVVPEPVDRWMASGALEGYYRGDVDPFTFQCHILQTKAAALRTAMAQAPPDSVIVMERGFIGDAGVFLRYNVDRGLVSEFQYGVYNDIMNALVGDVFVNGVIYLDASPATCCDRVASRGRPGEESVSESLLEKIQTYYEGVISSQSCVLRVDAENEVDVESIEGFIKRS